MNFARENPSKILDHSVARLFLQIVGKSRTNQIDLIVHMRVITGKP